MGVKFGILANGTILTIGTFVVFGNGALPVFEMCAWGTIEAGGGVGGRCVRSCIAAFARGGRGLLGLVVVETSKASGARGSSGGVGVKSLWAGVAEDGGKLIGVEALWACLATIGGGCVFVQAGCAWRTGAVVLGGASEGGRDAGVEAPPNLVPMN